MISDNAVVKLAAWPLLFLYRLITLLRYFFYKIGLFRSYPVAKPVISVGNIAMGGTGKTPFVVRLCRQLQSEGKQPVVLTRGYGRSDENSLVAIGPSNGEIDPKKVGDEAAELARLLTDIPIICIADRVAGAEWALERYDPDVFVLDDGFQHFRLRRNLDIVLLPARGTIFKREFNFALRRATVVMGSEQKTLDKAPAGIPCFKVTRKITGFRALGSDNYLELAEFITRKIAIATGIAVPVQFKESLEKSDLITVKSFFFADHHKYTQADINRIEQEVFIGRIDCVVTTEKDAAKIQRLNFKSELWFVARLELNVDRQDQLLEIIRDRVKFS